MFQCSHCGICCTDTAIAINLTVGDLVRLAAKLQKSIAGLFPEIVNFNPFPDEGIIAFEPGLNKPCALHIHDRCSIYTERPLNCRIFPFWLLKAPKQVWPVDYDCLDNLAGVSEDEKKQYIAYAKQLADIIMQESQLTEEVLAGIGIRKIVDVSNHPEYKKIMELPQHEQGRAIIKLGKELRDDSFFRGGAEKLEKAIMYDAELLKIINENTQKILALEKVAYPHGNSPEH